MSGRRPALKYDDDIDDDVRRNIKMFTFCLLQNQYTQKKCVYVYYWNINESMFI